MASVTVFGPFGWCIPALMAWLFLSWDLGWVLFPRDAKRTRWLGGLAAALGFTVALLQLSFYLGWLRPTALFAALCLSVVAIRYVRRSRRAQEGMSRPIPLQEWVYAVPVCLTALVGVSVTALAAYWLPIWQWDSLGYHLPFVNFVLQDGGVSGLPLDVGYLSTYPRNVELLFVALRATLPDDRLIDFGQIPFGLMAAATTAGIARELGASKGASLAAGALLLTLPALYLQLPTNYVDVASAAFFLLALYFLIVPPSFKTLLLACVGIGLFLGTKPSAPPAAVLLGITVLVRAKVSGHLKWGLLALVLGGSLGLEAYLTQLIRHGNPVWPAIVEIGPWQLPGTISVKELLSSGAGAPKVHGPLWYRVFASWSNLSSMPTFDMRVGGLGHIFWVAVPFGLLGLIRRRSLLLAALMGIAITTADPAVVRYIFQFPALLLALAAAEVTHLLLRPELSSSAKRVVGAGAVALSVGCGAYQLVYAFPGLTGEGPPLLAYANLSWAQREWAVGANGRPTAFVEARQRLAPGELAVYDRALWLPYLMWRSDAANRVTRIPDGASPAYVSSLLDRPETRLIAVGKDQPAHPVIVERSEYQKLFECREPCTVYLKQ
jgi:hypothetical protein